MQSIFLKFVTQIGLHRVTFYDPDKTFTNFFIIVLINSAEEGNVIEQRLLRTKTF